MRGCERWVPSRKVAAFQIGKASKPSLTKQNLKNIQKNLTQLRYSIHVIDSEHVIDDIPLSMFDELLSISEELGGYATPVLTIPVRRSDFEERMKECIEVLRKHKLGGVCIVAGNPAYLSAEEKSLPARRLLIKAAEAASKETINDGKLLMVGSENIERTAAYIAAKYKAIPFTLLDDARRGEVKRLSSTGMPVAVYAPYYIGNPAPDDALNRARAYALRRLGNSGGGGEVEAKMTQVTMLGSIEEIRRRVREVAEEGASIVVGYPLEERLDQVRGFADAVLQRSSTSLKSLYKKL